MVSRRALLSRPELVYVGMDARTDEVCVWRLHRQMPWQTWRTRRRSWQLWRRRETLLARSSYKIQGGKTVRLVRPVGKLPRVTVDGRLLTWIES